MSEQKNTLWTKNFTIITVGSAVSLLGTVISGYASGLMILDFTESVFLFSLFMIATTIPSIIVPTIVGPLLDKFSRRRTIFMLDFASAAIYMTFGIILSKGNITYPLLLCGCVLLGCINATYRVAFESLYPMLVTEGNMAKAYSISSTLDSLIMFLTPVSVFLYHSIGISKLYMVDAFFFFVAALFEMQVQVEESYRLKKEEKFGFAQYKETFVEGMQYLFSEKGLFIIAVYFFFLSFDGGAGQVVGLPYFRERFTNGDYIFIFIQGAGILGRVLAGAFHYKKKIPKEKKFAITFIVYACITIIEAAYLYVSIPLMILMMLINGVLSMTSYNIRISTTQSYVPNEKKGRFNGAFQVISTSGSLLGQFFAGLMADHMDKRLVIVMFAALNLVMLWVIVYRGREAVKKVYNRDA